MGTELLPFLLADGQGEEAALTGFWAFGRHGAGGVEEIAKGEETLVGRAGAVDGEVLEDASVEKSGVGQHGIS